MKKFLLTSLVFSFSLLSFANDLASIEKELLSHLKKVIEYNDDIERTKGRINPIDSLEAENKTLTELLLKYTVEKPSSITYAFDSLRKYMDITTSDDYKLRIYSWKKEVKDGMKYCENIFQYEADSVIYSTTLVEEDEFNPKGLFTGITIFEKDSTEKIYLAYLEAQFTENDYSDSFETFKIEGKQLTDSIPLFKVYDEFNVLETKQSLSVLYNPLKKRATSKLLKYNPKKKQIKVMITDKNGYIEKKFEEYDFIDNMFQIPVE